MGSFTNSFDSEIVLLGGKNEKNNKVSRVGASPDDHEENEDDLNIQDSVSIRTLCSNFQTSGKV